MPCTTVSGRGGGVEGSSVLPAVRESFWRREAASMVFMLWPCVARIRKWVGSGSLATRARAVVWAAAVADVSCSEESVGGDGVVSCGGLYRRPNLCLSEDATAFRIS